MEEGEKGERRGRESEVREGEHGWTNMNQGRGTLSEKKKNWGKKWIEKR